MSLRTKDQEVGDFAVGLPQDSDDCPRDIVDSTMDVSSSVISRHWLHRNSRH
jgi:hypothetical protein